MEMKKGWQIKTLGDVCEVIAGQSPEGKFYNAEGKGMAFYQGKKDFGDKFIEAPTTWTTQTTKIAKEGDILMSVRAPVGPVNFATDAVCIGRGLAAIRSSDELNRDFLFYQLWHLQPEIAGREGAVFASINKAEIEALPLAYAPLAEQQRIVGLLDEAFEGLATAKANAEKNLQNARALFESHLQSVFTQRGPGWKVTTLGAEIDLLAGFAFKSAKYTNDEDDIRLLRGDNIIQGCLRWDDVKRWPADDTGNYERYELEEGDVVLAMDRPWVKAGLKHATISAVDLPCLLVQRTARLRGGANLDNRFLKQLIGSSAFTGHILGVQTGIGVPHISGQQIKDFEFALPPVTEQRRIADNLESLHEETQRLARLYERKLAALEALKKSLLHQAFSGEL
jgi:type I restriction enzyme S subunit